jgi:hypothetical protein
MKRLRIQSYDRDLYILYKQDGTWVLQSKMLSIGFLRMAQHGSRFHG